VALFFLISGYIIPRSLETTPLAGFWLRRAFRLFPLYWFSIALYLLVGISAVTAPHELLANLTMLQPYFGVTHVNSVYWSLTVELTFYAMLTALLLFGLHRATFAILLVSAILIGVLANIGQRGCWISTLSICRSVSPEHSGIATTAGN
jgi:peptidoglycan/LPS O-acetylase OafA/YrhL